MSSPAIIAVRPTTDPTDRSMPPVRITNVMPMARIALMAVCLARISRLVGCQELVAAQQRGERSGTG